MCNMFRDDSEQLFNTKAIRIVNLCIIPNATMIGLNHQEKYTYLM